jgi:serine/threonine protein kinase
VRSKIDGKVYAMKLLNKVEICRALDKTSYWEERDVMAHNIDSDRIVRLDYAFQDDTYLYLVMEFVPGGYVAS